MLLTMLYGCSIRLGRPETGFGNCTVKAATSDYELASILQNAVDDLIRVRGNGPPLCAEVILFEQQVVSLGAWKVLLKIRFNYKGQEIVLSGDEVIFSTYARHDALIRLCQNLVTEAADIFSGA